MIYTLQLDGVTIYSGTNWFRCKEMIFEAHCPENRGKVLTLLKNGVTTHVTKLY